MSGLEIRAPDLPEARQIVTPESLAFLELLARHFGPRRQALLQRRREVQRCLKGGEPPDFLEETRQIRERSWQVASAPADLNDRRVEITGPVERKMMINALNSGARVFMADLEDALSPTWDNVVTGQWAIQEAVRQRLSFQTDEKTYALNPRIATLVIRP